MINELCVLSGFDKNKQPEPVAEFTLSRGQVVSIVGFTGSGKSQLIWDIDRMAQRDTVTKRQVLIDGKAAESRNRRGAGNRTITHLSQNMNFVMDMSVGEFIKLHAACREIEKPELIVDKVVYYANQLAGEPVEAGGLLTALSGGQSRALMIADLAVISNSPVMLLDEVENAGIDRKKALSLLADFGKMVLIVTHDPVLALRGERRIVMKNGAMYKVLNLSKEESQIRTRLERNSEMLFAIQDSLRKGDSLNSLRSGGDMLYEQLA